MTDCILVTGATGRVGGALCRALGPRARPAARDPLDLAGAVRFDFADAATHGPALDGVTAVFLMRPPAMARAAAFDPFLDAMVHAGVRCIAVLSVRGAERAPLLPHHWLERHVMARDLDWTMLRPADFMQNLETVHRDDIRDRDEIAVPAGDGRSAFVDADDVAGAAATVLTQSGHARKGYALTGPASLTFGDVARDLSAALGRRVRYRPVSVARFVAERRGQGTPLALCAVMSALYTAQRLGAADGVTDDLPRLLGRPATAMAGYAARETATWRA